MVRWWVGGLSCGPGICVSWSVSGLGMGLVHCYTGLGPSVGYFTDRSRAVLLLWIFFFSVLCLLCICMRLFICALCPHAGKWLTSWLSFVVSSCEFERLATIL